jgi:hypothetical protein
MSSLINFISNFFCNLRSNPRSIFMFYKCKTSLAFFFLLLLRNSRALFFLRNSRALIGKSRIPTGPSLRSCCRPRCGNHTPSSCRPMSTKCIERCKFCCYVDIPALVNTNCLERSFFFFFDASRLVSVHVQIHTNPTHAHHTTRT